MRGIFVKKPTLKKSRHVWDVSIVMNKLKTLYPFHSLTRKELTLKCVMLLLMLTGQRGQTVHLKCTDVKFENKKLYISYTSMLKTSKPMYHLSDVVIDAFIINPSLCLVETLSHYLERTKNLRKCESLFLSFVKPHNKVSRDSASRWVKQMMILAGIDVNTFTPHSTRAAVTSAAKQAGVPIHDILRNAGWTNSLTFLKFYDKVIVQENTDEFANSVLEFASYFVYKINCLYKGFH